MNGNGRPIGVRRRVQYLVILALLAWATQILMQQWGFGADAAAAGDVNPARPGRAEPLERRAAADARDGERAAGRS